MKTKTFIFHTLDEEMPPLGVPVLVRFNELEPLLYYVCELEKYKGEFRFCESGGEQYSTFPLNCVECWAYLDV